MSRPDPILEKLRRLSTPPVSEALGKRGYLLGIKPIFKPIKMVGTAYTVLCPRRDNLTLHMAIYRAKPGQVLVVNTCMDMESGYWGEIMSMAARKRGLAGLVIEGCVRDSEAIAKMGFPVYSCGISVRGTVKERVGVVECPIPCGGEIVRPGDYVLGDEDGVVVVPREDAPKVVETALKKMEGEKTVREKIAEGESTLRIYGFDEKLRKMGIEL
ncbi:MAG TPA: 4-carboxy-4-hydroxy-2-oxoadipate aldolase/oxaloacetate decarboxylase [Candidatus Bathyarchaeota archaeon]|nr:4-carboxy-4-hydroxy-2-oxoadipate aldolase/oxaloacetate decarboxylase [Candidatus Bathyarchaeota archaeon]